MKIISLSVLLAFSTGTFPGNSVETIFDKVSTNKEVIKVFATPGNEGSITVCSANPGELSFYLFDLDGKLVYQTPIKQNERVTVEGLVKGTYYYSAFKNDVNIKGGNVILK